MTFGGRYGDSPIIAQDGVDLPPDEPNDYVPTASPGGRPPHAWLEDGRSLYDTFHTEWTLLALGATDPATDGFKNAAQSMGIDLKVVRLPAQQLLELYESPLVLIRPDQIVAWRGASDEDGQQVLSLALGGLVHGRNVIDHRGLGGGELALLLGHCVKF